MPGRERYRNDWWALSLMAERSGHPKPNPGDVVRPTSTQEVSEILSRAAADRRPVVAWGAGSGVVGAAEPGPDALLVDMGAMAKVLKVDEESLVFTAQAGIMGPALERKLGEHSLTLGHFPQSFHLSTLGGWISTKATGQMSTLYGGIEERLLAVEVVLPDGTVVKSKASPRSSTGPDWWRLFLGAEGTLGIVTEATLSAFRVTDGSVWLCFQPPSFNDGLDLVRRIMQAGVRPAVARLYDANDAGVNFQGSFTSLLILRFEGILVVHEVEAVLALAGDVAQVDPKLGEHWWAHRFDAAGTYRKLLAGDGALGRYAIVDTMEVAGFWSDLRQLYSSVKLALESTGVMVMAHASHPYITGSALYFTFLSGDSKTDKDAEQTYYRVWEVGMRAVLDAGGTISHHHGVGLLKSGWMAEELGTGLRVLREIKAALDPNMIMNPGKLGL
ncbi:MAG: FAD-binding oxidoreductase [Actinomycetota bacterium]